MTNGGLLRMQLLLAGTAQEDIASTLPKSRLAFPPKAPTHWQSRFHEEARLDPNRPIVQTDISECGHTQ